MAENIYTSSRDTLLDYSYVERLLCLDKRDECINRRLLNDSFGDITFFLGVSLEELGYTEDSLPDSVKEAALSIFAHKLAMYKKAGDYVYGDDLDDVIEAKLDDGRLDYDEFFDAFSSIPDDAALILGELRENLAGETA